MSEPIVPASPADPHRDGARARVVIIDDDAKLNALLTEYLGRFGYSVRTATHPRAGIREVRADPPDLVILDIMLPDTDGLTVCRRLREFTRVPVIMLTARGDVTDRIIGLEMGADDYLPKPFEPRELVARMQAVLRRGPSPDGDLLRAGSLVVDATRRIAVLDGTELALTTGEFEVLALLVRNRGRALSRDRLMDETRGVDWEAYDRSIDVLISRLRQKLGDDPRQPRFIRTIRGVGYGFIGGGDD